MKKIIKNKLYDTSTSREIGCHSNGLSTSDFGHMTETLYRKKTGEYFLHGVGGPMSRYSKSCGQNSWTGDEKIIPLTYENAREWAAQNLDTDEFIAAFGEVAEDDSMVSMGISVTATVAEKIRRYAAEQGMAPSAYITQLVNAVQKQ